MKTSLLLAALMLPNLLFAQQLADSSFHPKIQNPEYEEGKGPVIFIDEAHFNFHTKDGRYAAFSHLLERDGYRMEAYTELFSRKALSEGKILVISNALNEINVTSWYLPTPSAFTEQEIKVLRKWVKRGGSLFLIADHMPMGGAAKDLAAAFGFEFSNGFVFDTLNPGPAIFNLDDGSLHASQITEGRNEDESVGQIASFTGQGFRIPDEATPILTFNENYVNFLPDTAWVFDKSTRKQAAEGWSQGAFRSFGKGKVVVFGEAAMFTAQIAGPQKIQIGMNSPLAPENYLLLLNIIHWLDGGPNGQFF